MGEAIDQMRVALYAELDNAERAYVEAALLESSTDADARIEALSPRFILKAARGLSDEASKRTNSDGTRRAYENLRGAIDRVLVLDAALADSPEQEVKCG